MFRQMYPASDLGMCIQQSSVPNVITYTELATFLWLKTTTGELHYYDGAGWEKVRATTSVQTSDVTGVLDALSGMGASKVLQRNAGNTAYVWTSPASLFSSNSFPIANLVNAVGEGYVITSTTGGAWTTELFTSLWDARFQNTTLPLLNLADVDGTTTIGQVLKANGHFGGFTAEWVEDLLRANTTPTSKINWGGAANAGKYPRVNATGTDVEYASTADGVGSVAMFVDTVASGAAAQALSANTLTTLRLAADGTLPAWATIASNAITLTPGTYLLEAFVPFYLAASVSKQGYIGWYNATPTLVKSANSRADGGQDSWSSTLICKFTVSATGAYTLKGYLKSYACAIGDPSSVTSIPEVYTQVKITKLA